MNKLSKLLLILIIILIISLILVTFAYCDMKKIAQENLDLYLNSEEKITQLLRNNPELQNTIN